MQNEVDGVKTGDDSTGELLLHVCISESQRFYPIASSSNVFFSPTHSMEKL